MASRPEGSRAVPGGSGVPVQRGEDQIELVAAVPEQWLDQVEDQDLADRAERLDRLAADGDLVLALALCGYTGPDWDYVATELVKYGMAVVGGWMRRGQILAKCRQRGSGGLHDLGRGFEPDEVEELAGETVAKALVHFRRDVLMRHRWNQTGGATLRTFFIGQCLLRFANIYRRFWGVENRFRRSDLTDDAGTFELFASRLAGVDTAAVERTTAAQALAAIKDPRVRRAMVLTADGRSQAEIAIELECTEKAVERMLAKQRQRFRDRRVG